MSTPRHTLVVTALILLSAASASASVDEIRLTVEGLACPFCTFGIEKSIKKVPGVVSLETTIRTGIVRIEMEPRAPLDPGALEQAVRDSGFTPASIEATVTGKLITKDEKPAFEVSNSGQSVLLVEPGQGEVLGALSEKTLKKLRSVSAQGSGLLTISGRVHSHVGTPPALAVEEAEVAR